MGIYSLAQCLMIILIMKKLLEQYKKKGYLYEQLERTDDWAIYSQRSLDTMEIVGYEVFKIVKRTEGKMFSHTVPAHESFPSDSQWGATAFTLWSAGKAFKKFYELSGINTSKGEESPSETPSNPSEAIPVSEDGLKKIAKVWEQALSDKEAREIILRGRSVGKSHASKILGIMRERLNNKHKDNEDNICKE